MFFLMTLFPGEEDYGAHRGREENERSPWPRVFQIQINIPKYKQTYYDLNVGGVLCDNTAILANILLC